VETAFFGSGPTPLPIARKKKWHEKARRMGTGPPSQRLARENKRTEKKKERCFISPP